MTVCHTNDATEAFDCKFNKNSSPNADVDTRAPARNTSIPLARLSKMTTNNVVYRRRRDACLSVPRM